MGEKEPPWLRLLPTPKLFPPFPAVSDTGLGKEEIHTGNGKGAEMGKGREKGEEWERGEGKSGAVLQSKFLPDEEKKRGKAL